MILQVIMMFVLGPHAWAKLVSITCDSTKQSPISIEPTFVEPAEFPPLELKNYESRPVSMQMVNVGTSAILTAETFEPLEVTGGPLMGNYQFEKLEFHWGSSNMRGSEHTINMKRYVCTHLS